MNTTRSPAPGRALFARFTSVTTRWRDNDVYGHMNNVVAYELFDTAVNGFLIEHGLLRGEATPIYLVVETGCRYFAPLGFPEPVEVGLAVSDCAGKAVTYRIGLFRPGAPEAAAEGRFVHVAVDRATMRAVPIPDAARAVFEALRRPG